MKILISNATMGHGGAERVISIVTKELVKKGHEVEVLLYYDKPIFYALDENVKVTIDEKVIGKANVIKHCLFRRKYIKTEKPDVVISFLAPFNMLMLVTMLGIRIPLVLADRNDPRKVPGNFVVRKVRDFLYRFADAVVVQNESNKAYFSKQVQKKCQVIYNPIDMGEYAGSALREKKVKKIVSVGRLVKQKNPQLLLDAFEKVHKVFPEYELVCYGEGELKKELVEKSIQYGLEDKVAYPGTHNQVFEVIKNAEVYVLTSNYEGMPNALLEAMCIGLPVISTKVSGATDVIVSGENGTLISVGSQDELESAMLELLENEKLRERYSANAVRLQEKLSCGKIAEEWEDLLNEQVRCYKRK